MSQRRKNRLGKIEAPACRNRKGKQRKTNKKTGVAAIFMCWAVATPTPSVLALDPPTPALENPATAVMIGGENEDEPLRSSPEATFLPGARGIHLGDIGQPGGPRGVDEALIIKMTYRAVATAARRSGHELRFELSDFQTHYREKFPHLLLSDLISLSSTTLAIEYTEVSHREAGQEIFLGVAYEPQWQVVEEPGEPATDWANITYGESLRMAMSDPESAVDDFREVVAVTTYRATVTFQEQSVSYRAMFVWLADENGAVRFLPQDYVTARVDEIWTLSQQAAPIEALFRGEPAQRPAE